MLTKVMKYSLFTFILLFSLLLIFMFYVKVKSLLGDNSDLSFANLECANLEGANLEGANLEGANLKCINHILCE